MAINVRNDFLEKRIASEAARRGHKVLTKTLVEVASERLTQLESQQPATAASAGTDEGGTDKDNGTSTRRTAN